MSASIWTALKAKFEGDTGSGGLNENSDSSNARVRHFVRMGDPNFDGSQSRSWPAIIVEIFVNESRVFGTRRSEAIVRMHLYTDRDANTADFTLQNAVADRMYVLFDGSTLTSQGTTEFSLLNQLRDFQAPSSGRELHRVFEYSVQPIVVAGV